MDTNNPKMGKSNEEREREYKARKIERLSKNVQTQQLLAYYGLSLTGDMMPMFGADHQLELAIYQNGEQVKQAVYPTLGYLSQDLGFVGAAGYEEIKGLKKIENRWRNRLLDGALKIGKYELNRCLHDLRPLLMERHIYFYTTPLKLVKTEVGTGKFTRDDAKRVLCPLPMSVQAAASYGCSKERIQELAPQVAWLIPMLVVYRKVKDTDKLMVYLDGWKALLTPQESERVLTLVTKHEPCIVSKQVTRLLLP